MYKVDCDLLRPLNRQLVSVKGLRTQDIRSLSWSSLLQLAYTAMGQSKQKMWPWLLHFLIIQTPSSLTVEGRALSYSLSWEGQTTNKLAKQASPEQSSKGKVFYLFACWLWTSPRTLYVHQKCCLNSWKVFLVEIMEERKRTGLQADKALITSFILLQSFFFF